MTTDTTDWSAFAQRLARRGERRLVLVEGPRPEALAWLRRQLPTPLWGAGLWTGPANDRPHPALMPVAPARARDWLGRELDLLVWDGWHGNPPDALAALAGTLRAGGLLFWLMPPLAQWPTFDDPDYARTGLDGADRHPFAARMAALLRASDSLIRVVCPTRVPLALPVLAEPETPFRVAATEDQARLVTALVRFGLGRRRRPVVVTADRGRGKSAALGLAAAQLLRRGRSRILVTGPSPDSIATLMRHAETALTGDLAEVGPDRLGTAAGAEIRYQPVPELLALRPPAEVLLVDEAAAIPPDRLRALLLGWPRVAFCSTVHGYEGSGRGFAIRFRATLETETPHWQALSLSQPVRWAGSDPLEPLIDRLFLLSASGSEATGPAGSEGGVTVEPWSPAGAPEAELAEAFGLLVDAHYRTTPADLRQWLDDPAAQTWCARVQGRIVGLLWAAREGGLPAPLAEAVAQGRRRLRGHLLAQSLACHGGLAEAARGRMLRVVRIAVAAGARRQGIGQRLVRAARDWSARAGLAVLGTSFGATPELLRFWQSCGLAVVRIGVQREASSGEYPLQMATGLNAPGQSLVATLRQRLVRHWPDLLLRHWQAMAPELLVSVLEDLPADGQLEPLDQRDLQGFAHGHRGYDLCWPVLRALSRCPGVLARVRDQGELPLWVAAVLRGRDWQALRQDGLCLGQRQGEARLRSVVRALLAQAPEL
ncbi:MAG: tRNA cytosine(34) acetyltransferase TmcA [Euryarchaeota archaeon]|nr:tRNA cytosine(34) acetyltransferase TmcA [Marinobacter sp.]